MFFCHIAIFFWEIYMSCLSMFFFWQANSTLCWASRSFLNLSNSSLSLLFSSTSLWVMSGLGDSDGGAEACDWGDTWWRFWALPGPWLSSADLWGTNLELGWGGSWLIAVPSSLWSVLVPLSLIGPLGKGPLHHHPKGGPLAKWGLWAQWGWCVLQSSCAVGGSPSLGR